MTYCTLAYCGTHAHTRTNIYTPSHSLTRSLSHANSYSLTQNTHPTPSPRQRIGLPLTHSHRLTVQISSLQIQNYSRHQLTVNFNSRTRSFLLSKGPFRCHQTLITLFIVGCIDGWFRFFFSRALAPPVFAPAPSTRTKESEWCQYGSSPQSSITIVFVGTPSSPPYS